ncbi:hypothetical protein [Flectobacillus major]|jgi:hypothetical protein|uniref:hypothetical protein n=1 Tax=Flectobacillus major TaxID=103 RepID=UPI00040EDB67|nr:hypothetical protein [Flectobacillus major]
MKVKFFWASLLTVASFGSFAQEIPAGDPGYSTSNYKHPNKAAAAAKKSKKGIPVTDNVAISRNYKQIIGSKSVEKAVVVERTQPKEEYLTWQNYKMPFSKKDTKEQAMTADSVKKSESVVD